MSLGSYELYMKLYKILPVGALAILYYICDLTQSIGITGFKVLS